MLKHKRMLAVAGAATMLATLAGAPAHAADAGKGPGGTGSGSDTFSSATVMKKTRSHQSAAAPMCREMTVDGGFEMPRLTRSRAWMLFNQQDVPGWKTDDPSGKIKIWGSKGSVPARFGKQFAELNATGTGVSVYQDIKTQSNTKIYWSFWIRARDSSAGKDVDATQIHFSKTPKSGGQVNGVRSSFAYVNSSDDAQWKRLYGWYMTGPDQTSTRVTLTAVDSASTDEGYGNLVDGLTIVDQPGCF